MRENYEGNVFSCMGCRSFLTPWKDENGNYKFEGRFNQGVVSLKPSADWYFSKRRYGIFLAAFGRKIVALL